MNVNKLVIEGDTSTLESYEGTPEEIRALLEIDNQSAVYRLDNHIEYLEDTIQGLQDKIQGLENDDREEQLQDSIKTLQRENYELKRKREDSNLHRKAIEKKSRDTQSENDKLKIRIEKLKEKDRLEKRVEEATAKQRLDFNPIESAKLWCNIEKEVEKLRKYQAERESMNEDE